MRRRNTSKGQENTKPKADIQQQGRCVVEIDADGTCLVVLPDGQIKGARSKSHATRICKGWFKKNTSPDHVGIGTIEWRL